MGRVDIGMSERQKLKCKPARDVISFEVTDVLLCLG